MVRSRLSVGIGIILLSLFISCRPKDATSSEDSYSRTKPSIEELVGIYVPDDLKPQDFVRGSKPLMRIPNIRLEGDGTFLSSGISSIPPDGTWSLQAERQVFQVWLIEFRHEDISVTMNICRQKPPYYLCSIIGDPEAGERLLFRKQ